MIYSFTGLKYHRPSSKVMFYVATFDRQETDTPPQKKSKFFNSPITKGSYCVLFELKMVEHCQARFFKVYV